MPWSSYLAGSRETYLVPLWSVRALCSATSPSGAVGTAGSSSSVELGWRLKAVNSASSSEAESPVLVAPPLAGAARLPLLAGPSSIPSARGLT